MARKPRIHLEGGVYHVLLRGNGGQALLFDPADRYRLYLLLQEGVERYGYRMQEIARHLGVHYSTVSRRIRKAERGDV